MKSWFLIYYNGDMDRCTEHFKMDVSYYGLRVPTKSLIESHLGIDIHNNWSVSEVKEL